MNPQAGQSADDPNGSPSHSNRKRSFFQRNRFYLLVGVVVFFIVVTASVAYGLLSAAFGRQPYKGPTFVVKKEPMLVTIVERGSLESAENSDIIVRVKAGTRGSTNASTIKWVIDDGTQVKAGDKLVELDDSGFQDQLKTQRNTVNKAFSDWIQASNDVTIQESLNETAIKTAEVALIQSLIELKKYAGEVAGAKMGTFETQDQVRNYLIAGFEGDVKKESEKADGKFTSAYLQDVSTYEGGIQLARSDADSWMDRASWSQRMVKKGFYSLSQADADQSRLESMKIALRKAEGDLDIYRIFEREKNATAKWSAVKEAERALKREQIKAVATMKQKVATEVTSKSIYNQELDRQRDMEKDEKSYVMFSPQDGMVVYYIPEQARFGGGSQQSTVAQGEPVRESQKLIRIPNLAKMLVKAKVHEAMISKVKPREVELTGYSDTLRLGFSVGRSDLYALATYQFAFEEIREKFRRLDQKKLFDGQSAKIRVDADPGKTYSGKVRSKATVPSQGDFLSSDVKLYETIVSIDDLDPKNEKLKPGMSAEVTIRADEIREPVTVIPIQSVVGNVKMHADRKCYVLDARSVPQERDIKLGMSNDTMVQVVEGLDEGEIVVLNPRPLIPEKSGMTAGTPGTRKGAEFDEGGGDAKKGKGKDGPTMKKGKGPQ